MKLLRHRVHVDPRGSLVALEQFRSLPFSPKRVFFMTVEQPGIIRGGHANSCDEFLVLLKGSVLVEVDNGRERGEARLQSCDQGLWIRAGIMIHLREFEAGTILLVCASELYEDTRHYDRAQPDLFLADCHA
ncbi:FdtA/QdtA family cupin domain-containing protein [Methylobacterium durans]|uniref:sugar 3,4-ketoisomerase n=1 Tax=Methylobacterium durans TaxID=2202825 RepID=UPI002AFF34B9|nr:FdtA/QdtA family cupin domain-containing protein [Methylobacterium durans]MEA1833507.1 FdtA/QdtA family cupin domain-containing protein [Methylobacterium durans]